VLGLQPLTMLQVLQVVTVAASRAIPHTFPAATQSFTSRASSGSSSCCPPSPSFAHVSCPARAQRRHCFCSMSLTLVACERCATSDSHEQYGQKALPRAVIAFVEENLNKSEPADTGEMTTTMLWRLRPLQRNA
jgi:hypothetical protein